MSQSVRNENRRNSPRRQPKRSSRALCVTGKFGFGPNVAVSLLDVSESGIRLVLKTALPRGHDVEVGLEAIGDHKPTRINGEVIWCVPMSDGNFCLGIRFDKPLKWTVLTTLTYF